MMFKFNARYFLVAVTLFIVEVLIALFVNDSFIRPYFGDFLVVILLYTFIKSFLDLPVKPTAIFVLLLAYLIETLQHFEMVKHLGLQHSKAANVILGNSFAWSDMVAYTLGVFLILWMEDKRLRQTR